MIQRKGAVAVVAVAMLAASCRNTESVAAEAPRVEVKGAVARPDAVNVIAPIDGTLERLAAPEGTVVRAGDLVAELTNPAIDRDLAYARAALAAAEMRSRLAHAPRTSSNDDGETIAAEIVRAKQEKLARYRSLLASGDVSRQEVLDAEVELTSAKRELLATRERRVAGINTFDPAVIRAELDRAQADVAFAEHRKALLVVRAPAAGVVTNVRARQGDEVFTRDTLAEVIDMSRVRVVAQIAPELLRFARAGAPVDVKLLTIPPRRYREPLAKIDAAGSGGASIVVTVPNDDRMLQPGTPAVITLQ